MFRSRQLRIILAAFAVVLVADQVTKTLVMRHIPDPNPTFRQNVFFQLTHQRNEGLVGGTFKDFPLIVYVAPALATLVLVYLFRHLDPASRIQGLAYGMVFGGAVGNILDRLRLGSVTDFLQFNFYFIPFNFPWRIYPAFNIADAAICVGVVVLILTWNQNVQPERHVAADS